MTRDETRSLPTLSQALARVHWRLIVLAMLLAGTTLLFSGLMTIRDYFERNLTLAASTIGYTVEPAVVFGDREAIEDGLRSAALSGVRSVELRSPDRHLLARWPVAAPGEPAGRNLTERVLGLQPVTQQVRHGGEVIAEIRVFGNSSGLVKYLLSGALISLCCLGIGAVALRIMARRMEEAVVTPLAEIAAVAHAVRRERAFDRRVRPSDIAEIDRFGRDFNALLSELEGWHHSMTAEQERLAHEATHDPLTGLGNRALFDAELGYLVAQAAKSGAPFALFYLDVDRFKQVNDTHGHPSGDALLITIATRLRSCIGPLDAAFRLGGDEFALLLAVTGGVAALDATVARIEECMAEPVLLPSGQSLSLSLSIGAAIHAGDNMPVVDLVARADAGMYQDKLRKRAVRTAKG